MYFNFYYYKKWWYKALTVLIIFALIVIITVVPVQRAKAVGILTVSLAAIIVAAMAGAGIYTVVAGLSFSDVQTWINNKLNEWDIYRNDGLNWYDLLIENNNVTATVRGFLKIEYDLATNIYNFIDWLIHDDLNMSSNTTNKVISNSGIFNLNEYFTITGENYYGVSHNTLYTGGYTGTQSRVILNKKGQYSDKVEFDVNFYSQRPDADHNWSYFIALGPNYPNNAIYTNLVNCDMGPTNYPRPNSPGLTCTGSFHFVSTINDYIRYTAFGDSTLNVTINNLIINDTPIEETGGTSLTIGTNTVVIPDVDTNSEGIILNPGITDTLTTVEGITSGIVEGVTTNTLNVTTTLSSEYVEAQEVVLINSQPISVDTDHHLFGFTLPSFDVNFVSIWHYVHDAITFSSGYIAHIVGMLNSVPVLAIPVYMSFTLMIVLGFIRKVL